MKKIFYFILLFFITACSPQKQESEQKIEETKPVSSDSEIDKNTIFSFDINTLKEGCENSSQIICAINYSIKCTINPDFSECNSHKSFMPNFIFMKDESLKRPTSQSYKITKIKPLANNLIEVYTQSTCNGNWFGLCNGNIIYVMDYQQKQWVVKDIYALEF